MIAGEAGKLYVHGKYKPHKSVVLECTGIGRV